MHLLKMPTLHVCSRPSGAELHLNNVLDYIPTTAPSNPLTRIISSRCGRAFPRLGICTITRTPTNHHNTHPPFYAVFFFSPA
jgi:hypothetical protein